jgi:phosphopantetheinyl transferase
MDNSLFGIVWGKNKTGILNEILSNTGILNKDSDCECFIGNCDYVKTNVSKMIDYFKQYISNFGFMHTGVVRNNLRAFEKFLTQAEKRLYYAYKTEKGRLEFLGGRVLLKMCLICELYPIANEVYKPTEISILRDKEGKPVLYIKDKLIENINLSISHRIDYIFCAVDSKRKIGVDVEMVSDKIMRLKDQYSSQDEENVILKFARDGVSLIENFTKLWTSKESVVKYVGSNLFDSIKNTSLVNIFENAFLLEYKPFGLFIHSYHFVFNNYVFSVIV